MKFNFKYILFSSLLTIITQQHMHAINNKDQLIEMHTKIETLHLGFLSIFVEGKKEGHTILEKISEISTNSEDNQVGILLNNLVKQLNAIFKTVKHIIVKYKGKGKTVLPQFLFDIGRSCDLEQLFKDTITQLQIVAELDTVNNQEFASELDRLLTFVKDIQPVWHSVMCNKTSLILNLKESL